MMRSTERFSSRAEHYRRYRPGYPPAAIDVLATRCGLTAGAVVADVGSGTGILSEQLLERGAEVIGIEPNDAMRAAAEAHLGGERRFRSVAATAEATTLLPQSVDLWVAAQAFHWFDAPAQPGAFLSEYEALLRHHAAEYTTIAARRADEASMQAFLGGAMQIARFPNLQTLDYAGLEGRLLSSSYAPAPGHPEHQPMLAGLRALFDRFSEHGVVAFPYETRVYYAQLESGG